MKIGHLENKAATPTAVSERKGSHDSKAAAGAASGATVALSPAATIMTATSAEGDFDTAKVQRIAQAIRDGKFQVNHEAIADKLIANAQELLVRADKG